MVVVEVDPTNPDRVRVAESNYDSKGNMRVEWVNLSERTYGGRWHWTGWRFGARP